MAGHEVGTRPVTPDHAADHGHRFDVAVALGDLLGLLPRPPDSCSTPGAARWLWRWTGGVVGAVGQVLHKIACWWFSVIDKVVGESGHRPLPVSDFPAANMNIHEMKKGNQDENNP